jgi:hypothetical protein
MKLPKTVGCLAERMCQKVVDWSNASPLGNLLYDRRVSG